MIVGHLYENGINYENIGAFKDYSNCFRNSTKDPIFVMLQSNMGIAGITSTEEFYSWYGYLDTELSNLVPKSYKLCDSSCYVDVDLPEEVFVIGVGKTISNTKVVALGVNCAKDIDTLIEYYGTGPIFSEKVVESIDNSMTEVATFINTKSKGLVVVYLEFGVTGRLDRIFGHTGKWELESGYHVNFIVNVYSDGGIVAKGYEEESAQESRYRLMYKDKTITYNRDSDKDPLIKWSGSVSDSNGKFLGIEEFRSSKWWLSLVNYKYDDCFLGIDLCSSVNYWVGRSDCMDTTKIYFYVENSKMLKDVSSYYGVKVPCSEDVLNTLDNSPESFRVRHYDLFGLGPGKWIPLVVASVVLESNVPTRMELYERTRWNEN